MAYIFDRVIGTYIDMAGKYRVTVAAKDGTLEKTCVLKFQSEPTLQQIQDAAVGFIYNLNNPPAPEETMDELKLKILLIVVVLNNDDLTALQKIVRIKIILGVL